MKKYIPGLDGLRGLSILIVLLHHANLRNFNDAIGSGLIGFDGQLGVNIFFVLSGFLITTLLLQEEEHTGTISLSGFYLRRSFRIFPVYFLLLFVYFLLQLAGVLHFQTSSWISSLTYTKYFNYHLDWETGHLWSLSIEEQFYLIWPFVFVLARKYRHHFAFLIILIVPMLRLVAQRYHIDWMKPLSMFQRADAIMWGCVFAMYHQQIADKLKQILSRHKWAIVLPFLIIPLMEIVYNLNVLYNLHLSFLTVPLAGTTGTVADICVGLIILISVHYPHTLWFRLLDNKYLKKIGLLSYSLYLWQQLFFSKEIGIAGTMPLNIVLIFATAFVSFYGVEKPFLKLKNRIEKRKKPVSSQAGLVAI